MTGLAIINSGFTFPAGTTGLLGPFPTDTYNSQLAAVAQSAGITHVFDPAFYSATTGIALDLNSAGTMTSANKVPVTPNALNGQPLWTFAAGGSQLGFISNFVKTETSFSLAFLIQQAAADQTFATDKIVWSSGASSNSFDQKGGNSTFITYYAGQVGPSLSIPGPFTQILLCSYDSETKSYVVQDKSGNVLASATTTIDFASGSAWQYGGFSGTLGFQGSLGQLVICNQALHLSANATAKATLLATLRSKYGL